MKRVSEVLGFRRPVGRNVLPERIRTQWICQIRRRGDTTDNRLRLWLRNNGSAGYFPVSPSTLRHAHEAHRSPGATAGRAA
jgi:hypothetical protein